MRRQLTTCRFVCSIILAASVLFSTCSVFVAQKSFAAEETKRISSFQLQPGDRLKVEVFREEDLSGEYEIDPSGRLMFPLIGDIKAAGLTIEELTGELSLKLKKYLVSPQVSVSRSEATIKSISVLGHVTKPGVYDYMPGATLMRLISTAGGFAESANKRKIKIVRMAAGEKETIVVNGLDIINGNAEDPNLEPGDIIFIPESVF